MPPFAETLYAERSVADKVMRKKRVLIIVDLQNTYLERIHPEVVKPMMEYVYNLLQLQKFDLIINVSYNDPLGRTTDKKLNKILDTIPKVVHISKDCDDGSWHIGKTLYAKGLYSDDCRIEIVGVNTDACVFSTVYGIVREQNWYSKNIYVHKRGSATEYGSDEYEIALQKLLDMKVNIIEELYALR